MSHTNQTIVTEGSPAIWWLPAIATQPLVTGNCKGKAFPLQAWTGPEGSRRLRLPDFKTVGT